MPWSHELQLIPCKNFEEGHNYLGLSEEVFGTTLPCFTEETEDPKAKDMSLEISLAPVKSSVSVKETVPDLLSN